MASVRPLRQSVARIQAAVRARGPRHSAVALAATVILVVAFVLLLLVALSLPLIKAVYILQVNATPVQKQPPTSIATELRFGVWGFCATS